MDYLVKFLVWSLGVFGTTNIIVVSTIFSPIREWVLFSDKKDRVLRRFKFPGKLITCPMCMGFWIGCFWSVFLWSPSKELGYYNNFINILFDGFLGSIMSWMLYLLIAEKQFKM